MIPMKKYVLILTMALASTTLFAQNANQGGKIVDFYGVDYSLAKVQGAMETPAQFKAAFSSINYLILAEYPKYNVAKYLGKDAVTPNIDVVLPNINAINEANIISNSGKCDITDAQVDSLVQTYKIPTSNNEVGVVMIGGLLSKSAVLGHYKVVFFENKTKKVLSIVNVSGKPAGFGVRNFWAGSVLGSLKDFEKKNK